MESFYQYGCSYILQEYMDGPVHEVVISVKFHRRQQRLPVSAVS